MKERWFDGITESDYSHAFLLLPVLAIDIISWVPVDHTSQMSFCRCGHTSGDV